MKFNFPARLPAPLLAKLLLIAFLASCSAQAATWYVTNNVTAGTGDGSSGNPWNPNYAFWQSSVNAGDTIIFKGTASTVYTNRLGTWNDQASYWRSGTAGNPITIRAENTGIIIRPAANSNPVLFIGSPDSQAGHEAQYITFDGFRFDGTNCGTTSSGVPVVKIDYGSFITLTNCDLFNSPGAHGILIADGDAHNITLTHCNIYSNAVNTANSQPPHGVYMSGATYSNTVEYCTIYGHTNTFGNSLTPLGVHIYNGGGHHDIVRYNYLHDNNKSIGIYTGTNHLVYGNIIDTSGTGAIMGIEVQASASSYYNNTIVGGGTAAVINYGIHVLGATTAENLFANNIVVSNRYTGILIDSGVRGNTWSNNLAADNASISGANVQDNSGWPQSFPSGNLIGNAYDAALTASPNFVPTASSSARNAGVTIAGYTADGAGTTVPTESITDIGAREYSSGGTLPVVTLSSYSAYAYQAGPVTGTFTITRDDATAAKTIVITMTGTAVNGTDYTSVSLTQPMGIGTATTNVVITPSTGTPFSGTKTVTLTISADAAYTLGTPVSGTMQIQGSQTAISIGSRRSAL